MNASVGGFRRGGAADLDPDRISFTRTLRLAAEPATVTAGIPTEDWVDALPDVLAEIAHRPNLTRRHRTCPRAVKTRPPQPIPRQEAR